MKAIDLFAGAGGFSTGAMMAGCRVVWAANHWQAAVPVHAINHPDALHVCQDLHQARWQDVPAHDIMLAQQGARQGIRQPPARRQPVHRVGRGVGC